MHYYARLSKIYFKILLKKHISYFYYKINCVIMHFITLFRNKSQQIAFIKINSYI